jgi:hypothetical protein
MFANAKLDPTLLPARNAYGAMHLDTTNFAQTPNWQQGKFIV